MKYLVLFGVAENYIVSVLKNLVNGVKNMGLSDWANIVTILTFILILIPIIKKWQKHIFFLLPSIKCVIEERGEKISFILDIKKYPEDLFYGEFTLSIKQTGGVPGGLIAFETYPAQGQQVLKIVNGYSESTSKRFTFKKTGTIESTLQIMVTGDIGNDIKKTHTLIFEKELIDKLLQQEGVIKLKRKWHTWPGSKEIKFVSY